MILKVAFTNCYTRQHIVTRYGKTIVPLHLLRVSIGLQIKLFAGPAAIVC